MKQIIGLIAVAIFIFIGVNLISPIQNQVEQLNNESVESQPTYSSAVSTLAGIIPIIFVAMIILGVVKAMASTSDEGQVRREKIKTIFRNSKEFILRIESDSKKYSKFLRNLDELLGVKTVDVDNMNDTFEEGLYLNGNNQLNIDSQHYDWYIADKHPELYMFKVVGLHKKDINKNVVYILGRSNPNDKPLIIKLPNEYIETKFIDLMQTKLWTSNKELANKV